MKLVQFGAGNIGRSFIGQIFSRSGWEVVFIDVNVQIVDLLNKKQFYTVVIKREGQEDERRILGPVRAIDGKNTEAIANEIATCDLVSTSVGKAALPNILPVLSKGISQRYAQRPKDPLDIIIAENARGADTLFRTTLYRELGSDFPLETYVGLVETSIGKMVPLMRQEDLEKDPLELFAEEYETLIVDQKGFRGPLPDPSKGWPTSLQLVDPIQAFVDRKLFIHNLGHAASAYLGYKKNPSVTFLAEALQVPGVETAARKAMEQAADALSLQYPEAYSRKELSEHIEDLIFRFKNRALGDTVHRVGRDLFRKLDKEDRIVGAMLLCAHWKLPFDAIAEVYLSAVDFIARDEKGYLFPEDERFHLTVRPKGIAGILTLVSHLDAENPVERIVIETVHRNIK